MNWPCAVTLLGAFAFAAPQAPKSASELAKLGPQVGARVPDFSLPDQDGRIHTLASVFGRNGAMLVFFRSADW